MIAVPPAQRTVAYLLNEGQVAPHHIDALNWQQRLTLHHYARYPHQPMPEGIFQEIKALVIREDSPLWLRVLEFINRWIAWFFELPTAKALNTDFLRTRVTVVGLRNEGATCFINAMVQYILRNKRLVQAIMATRDPHLQELRDFISEAQRALAERRAAPVAGAGGVRLALNRIHGAGLHDPPPPRQRLRPVFSERQNQGEARALADVAAGIYEQLDAVPAHLQENTMLFITALARESLALSNGERRPIGTIQALEPGRVEEYLRGECDAAEAVQLIVGYLEANYPEFQTYTEVTHTQVVADRGLDTQVLRPPNIVRTPIFQPGPSVRAKEYRSLQKGVDSYFHSMDEVALTEAEQALYHCRTQHKKVTRTLDRAPKHLLVTVIDVGARHTQVTVPLTLNLPGSAINGAAADAPPIGYEISSFLYHRGGGKDNGLNREGVLARGDRVGGIDGGHYLAYQRVTINGVDFFVELDDTRVREVSRHEFMVKARLAAQITYENPNLPDEPVPEVPAGRVAPPLPAWMEQPEAAPIPDVAEQERELVAEAQRALAIQREHLNGVLGGLMALLPQPIAPVVDEAAPPPPVVDEAAPPPPVVDEAADPAPIDN